MKPNQYTITLGRLHELPQVLSSYREQKAKVRAVQDGRIHEKVEELFRQLRGSIESVEIPVTTGRVLRYMSVGGDARDSIVLSRSAPATERQPYDTELFRADIRSRGNKEAAEVEEDFDPADEIAHRIFKLLYGRMRERFPQLYPEGNVKVQLKRARVVKVDRGLDAEGAPTVEQVDIPEHVIVTVSIPTRLLYPQQTAGRRKAKRSRKGPKK